MSMTDHLLFDDFCWKRNISYQQVLREQKEQILCERPEICKNIVDQIAESRLLSKYNPCSHSGGIHKLTWMCSHKFCENRNFWHQSKDFSENNPIGRCLVKNIDTLGILACRKCGKSCKRIKDEIDTINFPIIKRLQRHSTCTTLMSLDRFYNGNREIIWSIMKHLKYRPAEKTTSYFNATLLTGKRILVPFNAKYDSIYDIKYRIKEAYMKIEPSEHILINDIKIIICGELISDDMSQFYSYEPHKLNCIRVIF